jgi:hypothetical protein
VVEGRKEDRKGKDGRKEGDRWTKGRKVKEGRKENRKGKDGRKEGEGR